MGADDEQTMQARVTGSQASLKVPFSFWPEFGETLSLGAFGSHPSDQLSAGSRQEGN